MREVLGGAPKIIQAVATSGYSSGEHLRDVSIATKAVEKLRATADAQRMGGEVERAGKTYKFLRWARSVQRDLVRKPYGTLSPANRATMLKAAGIELPPLPEAQVPEVLKNLPKKPPGRV